MTMGLTTMYILLENGLELAIMWAFNFLPVHYNISLIIFSQVSMVLHWALLLNFQVVEAALLSRVQRLEQRLMTVEPRVSMGT